MSRDVVTSIYTLFFIGLSERSLQRMRAKRLSDYTILFALITGVLKTMSCFSPNLGVPERKNRGHTLCGALTVVASATISSTAVITVFVVIVFNNAVLFSTCS